MIDIFGWWRRQIAAATVAGVGDAVKQMTAGTDADDARVAAMLGITLPAAPPALPPKSEVETPTVSTNGSRRKVSAN